MPTDGVSDLMVYIVELQALYLKIHPADIIELNITGANLKAGKSWSVLLCYSVVVQY